MSSSRRRRRQPTVNPFGAPNQPIGVPRPQQNQQPETHHDTATDDLAGLQILDADYRDADDLPTTVRPGGPRPQIRADLLTDDLSKTEPRRTAAPAQPRHQTPPAPASPDLGSASDFDKALTELDSDTTIEADFDFPDNGFGEGDLHSEPDTVIGTDQSGHEPHHNPDLDFAFDTPTSATHHAAATQEPEPEIALSDNQDVWAALEADDQGTDESPDFFAEIDASDTSRESGFFRRHDEPAPIDNADVEAALAAAQERSTEALLDSGRDEIEDNTPAPLAVDRNSGEASEWKPGVHVAARYGRFAGPPALSIVSQQLKDEEQDEIAHVLTAFQDLQEGQKGFVRFSCREWPEFKNTSKAWLQASKVGEDPGAKSVRAKAFSFVTGWLTYLPKLAWYEMNKSNPSRLGGLTPPVPPGGSGEVKKLRPSDVDDDTKMAWKDAELKARDSKHYEVDLRVGVVTLPDAAEEAERIADEVAAGFDVYNNNFQQLVWGRVDPYDAAIGYMGIYETDVPSLALSAGELGQLAHVPDDRTEAQGVKMRRSNFKQMPLGNPLIIKDPYNPPRGGHYGKGLIPLGLMNAGSEDEQCFGMRVDELDKHLYLSGRTGTGKSETLKWLIFGCAKAGYPIVVIDPHGQLYEDILNMLVVNVPERMNDILGCDLSDADYPVALNPLDVTHFEQVEPTVQSVLEMMATQMQLGAQAPRAVNLASQAIGALCEANLHLKDPETKCTLLHIVTFFLDPEFRRLVLEFSTNPTIKENFDPERGPFEQMSEKQQAEMAMPIIRAIQPIGNSPSFAAVFSAGENRLDFGKLINDRKIVLVKLARFSHQKKIGELIGSLIVPWIMGDVENFGRKKDPETGVTRGAGCRVFVDEAQTLIGPTSSVPELLAEARKYDLGLCFANQFLSQLDPRIIMSTLANTGSKLSLALDPASSVRMANSISPNTRAVTAGDIAELPNFHYYANVLLPSDAGGTGGSGPFSSKCLPMMNCDLTPEHKRLREHVKARSRKLLCNDRDEILEKRQHLVENIKGALGELWRERADHVQVDPLGGGDGFSLDLDKDAEGDAWQRW
jgi:hypothetical protein